VPRHVAGEAGDCTQLAARFAGTVLPVPEGSVWRDLVTGDEVRSEGGRLAVERLFARLPLAVLRQSAS
jgi:(1->4)-alpha-D-glucan 1-alpha-D-glucosylmutase